MIPSPLRGETDGECATPNAPRRMPEELVDAMQGRVLHALERGMPSTVYLLLWVCLQSASESMARSFASGAASNPPFPSRSHLGGEWRIRGEALAASPRAQMYRLAGLRGQRRGIERMCLRGGSDDGSGDGGEQAQGTTGCVCACVRACTRAVPPVPRICPIPNHLSYAALKRQRSVRCYLQPRCTLQASPASSSGVQADEKAHTSLRRYSRFFLCLSLCMCLSPRRASAL